MSEHENGSASRRPQGPEEATVEMRAFTDRSGVRWYVALETRAAQYDATRFPPEPTGTLRFRSADSQRAMPTALPAGALAAIRAGDLQALLDAARESDGPQRG